MSWSVLGDSTNLNWTNSITSICSDSTGNVYAGGTFINSSTGGKRYVAKYDGVSWSELGGFYGFAANNYIFTICSDGAGNIYAAGKFTNANGNRYVAKYDGNSWSELGGLDSLAANNSIYSINSDGAGNIYAAGFFSNNSGNYYVAKYNNPTSINPITSNSYVSLYPNPATNHLTITLPNISKKINLTITDITGKIIYNISDATTQKIEVNTKDFTSGIYFVQIQTPGFVETKKLVLAK